MFKDSYEGGDLYARGLLDGAAASAAFRTIMESPECYDRIGRLTGEKLLYQILSKVPINGPWSTLGIAVWAFEYYDC
jgi:hypothetical protein